MQIKYPHQRSAVLLVIAAFGLAVNEMVLGQTGNNPISPWSGRQCPDGKIRGVNLGGWLVLEEWMLPQLFDEFHQQYNGSYVCLHMLNMHIS